MSKEEKVTIKSLYRDGISALNAAYFIRQSSPIDLGEDFEEIIEKHTKISLECHENPKAYESFNPIEAFQEEVECLKELGYGDELGINESTKDKKMTKEEALELIEKLIHCGGRKDAQVYANNLREIFLPRMYDIHNSEISERVKTTLFNVFLGHSDEFPGIFSQEFLDALKEKEKTPLEVFQSREAEIVSMGLEGLGTAYRFSTKEIEIIEKALGKTND